MSSKEEIKTKYIDNYNWSGYFKIDGDLGDQKKVVELATSLNSNKLENYFFLEPACDIITVSNEVSDLDSNSNLEAVKKYNFRYEITMRENQSKKLELLINYLNLICKKEFLLVLKNYSVYDSKEYKELNDKNIYKLLVSGNKETTFWNVIEGKWKPSFSENLLVASWTNE
jgi:hypothetical protein